MSCKIIPFPGSREPLSPLQDKILMARLCLHRDDLLVEGIDPRTIRSHEELEALLQRIAANVEATLEGLPDDAPESRTLMAVSDAYSEDADTEAARQALGIVGDRVRTKGVE